jgi:nucleoside-diphosphate-sugar epimerase
LAARSVFILGAGQIGRAAAVRLAAEGCAVRLAHRPGRPFPLELREAGIEEVLLDRSAAGDLSAGVGEGADAVIDTIAYTPADADQLRSIQDRVGAFVVISSCSVYRDADGRTLDEAFETGFPRFSGAIPETQPTTRPSPETYSTRKVALEEALGAIDRPVAVLRPGAIHGPGCNAPREWWFVKRALDGRTRVPLAYDGASRFHTTAAANIAELCKVVLETGASGVFNIGDPEPPSVREIGGFIAEAMGQAWDLVGLPKHAVGTVGATPWSVPRPMLIDTSKAEALGYTSVMSYRASMAATCEDLVRRARQQPWQEAFPGLAAYTDPWFDYAAEDAFLAA